MLSLIEACCIRCFSEKPESRKASDGYYYRQDMSSNGANALGHRLLR
jgi:hypothetical protein